LIKSAPPGTRTPNPRIKRSQPAAWSSIRRPGGSATDRRGRWVEFGAVAVSVAVTERSVLASRCRGSALGGRERDAAPQGPLTSTASGPMILDRTSLSTHLAPSTSNRLRPVAQSAANGSSPSLGTLATTGGSLVTSMLAGPAFACSLAGWLLPECPMVKQRASTSGRTEERSRCRWC
jgi:hypothetical protein